MLENLLASCSSDAPADATQAGLIFVAFGKSVDAFEAQLKRMAGAEDGTVDALFTYEPTATQAVLEKGAIKILPVLAAVFVAEIGDVHRFSGPDRLASWCGMTPKHRESDTHVHRGRITKQGSRLVRWAAVESVQTLPKTTRVGAMRERIGERRGHNIGVVAAARKQLGFVYYALRDHHVRALHTSAA